MCTLHRACVDVLLWVASSTITARPSHTTPCSLLLNADVLRVIAKNTDTRPRLWRQLKDWDWSPLIACLRLQVRPADKGLGCTWAARAQGSWWQYPSGTRRCC